MQAIGASWCNFTSVIGLFEHILTPKPTNILFIIKVLPDLVKGSTEKQKHDDGGIDRESLGGNNARCHTPVYGSCTWKKIYAKPYHKQKHNQVQGPVYKQQFHRECSL